jgi:rhodanese-related sulfurtransferase
MSAHRRSSRRVPGASAVPGPQVPVSRRGWGWIAALGLAAAIAIAAAACSAAATAPSASTQASAAASAGPSTASPGVPAALPLEVDVAEASRLRDAGAFVLDVREPSEWAVGHIPGATLIPLGQLASRTAEVPSDRQVVVVCHSGNRSAQGRDILLAAGFPSVTSMAGGMSAWTAAGNETVTGS